MSGILRLESLTKGNTLKQGDKTPLKYKLFDADGEKLNVAGKPAKVRLVYPDFLTIGYEKGGITVAQDDTVTFTIDTVIPSRIYHVEIIVDDKFIFPSRADEAKFTVDKSSLGTEANVIEIVGVDQIVNTVLGKVDADISQAVTEITATNEAIKQAEQERVQGYQEIQQLIEDGALNAVPADGSLTTPKYADKSVTAEKTDFIEVSKTDKSNLVDLFEGGLFGGVIHMDTPSTTNPLGGLIALIRGLKVGDKYTIEIPYNEAEPSKNRFLLYGLPDNYSYPNSYKIDHEYVRDYSLTKYTFVAEHTNVGLYVSQDKQFRDLYEGNIKINRIITKLDEDLLPSPKDIEVVNLDAHISTVDNTAVFKYKGDYKTLSAFFNVDPGKTYKVDVSDSSNLNRFRIYGLKQRDWDKLLIERSYMPFDYTIYRNDDNLRTLEFTVPNDCLSIGIYLSSSATSSTYANVEVEEVEISADRILQEVTDKIMPMIHKKFFTVGEPGTYLMSNDINPTNVNVDDIMAIYESIEADPHVQSKQTLGTNSNGDPIYEYTIVKPRPKYISELNPTPIPLPYEELGKIKILLLSGVHGDEKGSALGMALFIKELIENKDDETLRYIRNNAIIKVVPIANPWGINNNTRSNQNTIDLNRDFIAKTQNETKLIAKWIEDNANAVAMIDYHNSAGETSYWVNEAYPIYHDLYFSVMSNLNDHWAVKYGMSQNAGALAKSSSLTTSTQFARNLGMLSWTMEASRHSDTMLTGVYIYTG